MFFEVAFLFTERKRTWRNISPDLSVLQFVSVKSIRWSGICDGVYGSVRVGHEKDGVSEDKLNHVPCSH